MTQQMIDHWSIWFVFKLHIDEFYLNSTSVQRKPLTLLLPFCLSVTSRCNLQILLATNKHLTVVSCLQINCKLLCVVWHWLRDRGNETEHQTAVGAIWDQAKRCEFFLNFPASRLTSLWVRNRLRIWVCSLSWAENSFPSSQAVLWSLTKD